MDAIAKVRVVESLTAMLEPLPPAARREIVQQLALLYHVSVPRVGDGHRGGPGARMSESIPAHIRKLGGKADTQQIAKALGTSYRSAAVLLSRAVSKGQVRRLGRNVYGLPGGGR